MKQSMLHILLLVFILPSKRSSHARLTQSVSNLDRASYVAEQAISPSHTPAEIWAQHKHLRNYEEIVNAAPDTFKVLPDQLSSDHVNPCWKDASTGELRCLPLFQILGVSKCGTTDLYARLELHPQILDCGYKGPHFWDETPWPPPKDQRPLRDFTWYVNIFAAAAAKMATSPQAVTGEASSNTFTAVYTYLRGLSVRRGINATLAQYLYEAQPYLRSIVMLRDPVDRYYSAFHYYGRRKDVPYAEPQEFHERALADVAAWRGCLAAQSQLQCLRAYQPQQLVKGMYAAFLPAWLQVFDREQLLVIRNEDYQAAPREHLRAVFRFLGVEEEPGEGVWAAMLGKGAANSQRQKYKAMLPETRELLREFYAPFNKQLAKILGDRRWLWLDTQPEAQPV